LNKHILITGGAGFIGSHLADEMLKLGYRVRALDNLSFQVHEPDRKRPDYLNPEVELIVGDVRDPEVMRHTLKGIDIVYHLAAVVGVGQSMYEITNYTSTNNLGTAVLLEALIDRPIERLIVASSMSIYGEGLYRTPNGHLSVGCERTLEQLKAGDWEVRNAAGDVLIPVATPEDKQPSLASMTSMGHKLRFGLLRQDFPPGSMMNTDSYTNLLTPSMPPSIASTGMALTTSTPTFLQ